MSVDHPTKHRVLEAVVRTLIDAGEQPEGDALRSAVQAIVEECEWDETSAKAAIRDAFHGMSIARHPVPTESTSRETLIRQCQQRVGIELEKNGARLPRPVIRRLITEIRDVLGHDDPTSATTAVPSRECGPERCRLCRSTTHWRLGSEPCFPWVCERCHPCPHSHDCVEWSEEVAS